MPATYEKGNNTRIKNAVAKFNRDTENVFISGFEALLRDAVQICLDMHSDGAKMHTQIGDSYGWIMFHDKQEIKREVNAGTAQATGNANEALSGIQSMLSSDGWVGVVLAGLEPPQYFAVNYEFWVMRRAINKLSSTNFSSYFKKI